VAAISRHAQLQERGTLVNLSQTSLK